MAVESVINARRRAARAAGRPAQLRFSLVAGANANTNINVAGIDVGDAIAGVFEFPDAGGTVVDRGAVTSITSAGHVQCTQATATSHLLIVWYDN